MNLPIYMDYHATTPVDPRVLAAMRPYFTERFGNPSSRSHSFGWQAAEAVEEARTHVARLIGADPKEIYFTSGATESDNLAIKGVVGNHPDRRGQILTSSIEHKAVLDACKWAEKHGFEVEFLPVDRHGIVDPAAVEKAITEGTILVSIILASNEIGTIEPVHKIGCITRSQGVLLHTDAAQAVGKIAVDVSAMQIDLLSLTAHKLYGPKGIGAIYVRGGNALEILSPLLDGGGQEGGLRPGTLNVPGIVGLGEACRLCDEEMAAESARLGQLRDRLRDTIMTELDDVHLNGHPTQRLAHNLNLSFGYVEGEALLMSMSDVAVSTGAACNSAGSKGSHVLEAIGLPDELVQSSVRIGLGRFTTEEEVEYVSRRMVEAVRGLRELSPQYAAGRANALRG
ncbi:MAG: aminotransferase class V-fold PLP-dependent enzyme [Acidobacteria bacterium]|nr:aminotransferase class V-fold PLP-dependent enzyme [Acidobacteriota bacterium]